jgi:hypothetical protein
MAGNLNALKENMHRSKRTSPASKSAPAAMISKSKI